MNRRLERILTFTVSIGIAGGLGYLLGYNRRPLPAQSSTGLMHRGERAVVRRAPGAEGESAALRGAAATLEREHPSSLTSDQLLQLAAGLTQKRSE